MSIDLLKAKRLLADPALYVAAAPLAASLFPDAAAWVEAHKVLLIPVLTVIAGHFGVRIAGVFSAGRSVEALTYARVNHGAVTNPPTTGPDPADAIDPATIEHPNETVEDYS